MQQSKQLIGGNLPLVIKPDHLRKDRKQPIAANDLRKGMDKCSVGEVEGSFDVVKVVLATQGYEKVVHLPCTGWGFDGHALLIFAEVES